jgi:hypothetical protein
MTACVDFASAAKCRTVESLLRRMRRVFVEALRQLTSVNSPMGKSGPIEEFAS